MYHLGASSKNPPCYKEQGGAVPGCFEGELSPVCQ
jgi:hypothetical protein